MRKKPIKLDFPDPLAPIKTFILLSSISHSTIDLKPFKTILGQLFFLNSPRHRIVSQYFSLLSASLIDNNNYLPFP